MANDFQATTEKHMGALENLLAPIFAKAPHLPEGGRKVIGQIAPWLALVFGILGLFAIVSAGSMMSVFALSAVFAGVDYALLYLALLVGLISSILDLLAFKPLTAYKKRGWNFLFYATVLSALATIVNLIFGYGYGLGNILGLLIGFWLLFEIRGLYR